MALSFRLKLIDCHNGMKVDAHTDVEYLALSYVWGSANSEQDQEMDDLSTAPPVIQDAIKITLQLSFRYLWVDRLCVAQNDAIEKHRQISNMDQIYAGAILTLIAAGESGPTRGLPGVSYCPFDLRSGIKLGHRYYSPLFRNPREEIEMSAWYTRGWTYQEGAMSTRKLVFTSTCLYLQCNVDHAFGCLHPMSEAFIRSSIESNLPPLKRYPNDVSNLEISPTVAFHFRKAQPFESWKEKSPMEEFYDHVHSYLPRKLTYESDRLNAIRGVLNQFRGRNPAVFHAYGLGFMSSGNFSINRGLFWRPNGKATLRNQEFPSWSWLGWDLLIEYPSNTTGNSRRATQSIIFADLTEEPRINGEYNLRNHIDELIMDKYTARVCVEVEGGRTVDLTKASFSNRRVALDIVFAKEARISPELLVRCSVFTISFRKNEQEEWTRVGRPELPFDERQLPRARFSMWLDVPGNPEDEEALQRDGVKGLVLGLFDKTIRIMLIRKTENCWIRVGIGQYRFESLVSNRRSRINLPFLSDRTVASLSYFRTIKEMKRTWIRLG